MVSPNARGTSGSGYQPAREPSFVVGVVTLT